MSTRLRTCWAERRTAFGLWLSTDSASIAEGLAGLDFDYVVIDLQHGLVDIAGAIQVMRSMSRTDATLLCRVPANTDDIIGRVLDAGAAGVIVPMVNNADQAADAVAACKYAPLGNRSFGPTRRRLLGTRYDVGEENDETIVIPMIETVEAVELAPAIAAVPGVDALYVGPADLSITLGLAPANTHADHRFLDALASVLDAARAHGIEPAIHADASLAEARAAEGFTMVTVVSDIQAVMAGAGDALDSARAERDR